MKTLFKFFVVVSAFFFLSPLHLNAMESSPSPAPTSSVVKIDGINPPAKKKKAVAKVKECAVTVEFFAPLEEQQLIINMHCGNLFSQTMRKEGDKLLPLTKNGSVAVAFDDPKDREFAEKVINMTKPDEALFLIVDPKAKPYFRHTIALKKASWKPEEVDALRQFIVEAFAPRQINIVAKTNDWRKKSYALPQFAVANNQPPNK